jgi:hypothetical protein
MAGLDPAIHPLRKILLRSAMDPRVKPAGDGTTRYFEEQVLRKRPYIQREWCRGVLAAPIRRQV